MAGLGCGNSAFDCEVLRAVPGKETVPANGTASCADLAEGRHQEDLNAYAKTTTANGRLERRHLAEIEKDLSNAGAVRSPGSVAIERGEAKTGAKTSGEKLAVRPYAHPFFWAGFAYTGL